MITATEIHAARILIVDDREANIALLEGILYRDGYTAIDRTLDPREVCELHAQNRYDLILLDLHMPAMDGFEVMAGLKALGTDPWLPVLVITAQPGHLLRALQSGARDFISKPFDLAEVLMRVHNLLEIGLLHKELLRYTKKLELRNAFICETVGRHLSEEAMEALMAVPDLLELSGQTNRVTMMTADLRGFTLAASGVAPEKVTAAVNAYQDKMVEILLDHGGTIDGFTADGILGLFGALVARPDDAHRAVACSVAMQRAMAAVNVQNHELGVPPMAMGVGLHSGDVIVSNIGSTQRAKYGALGSAVKLTARVGSCSLGGQVLISQSTFDAVRDYVDIEPSFAPSGERVPMPFPIYSISGVTGQAEQVLPRM